MADEGSNVRLHVRVPAPVASAIEAFRDAEGLSSTAEALRLLVEIGLDTVSTHGRRFWDKTPGAPEAS
jgi:hypothetical protein